MSNTEQEIRTTPRQYHDPKEYFTVFGYGPSGEGAKGKRILDVGSGPNWFAEALVGMADVVGLDPDFRIKPPNAETYYPVAVQDGIPAPDESFDDTVAHHVLRWITSAQDAVLLEMLRVTKAGGRTMVYPTGKKAGFKETSRYQLVDPSPALPFYTLVLPKIPNTSLDAFRPTLQEVMKFVDLNPSATFLVP